MRPWPGSRRCPGRRSHARADGAHSATCYSQHEKPRPSCLPIVPPSEVCRSFAQPSMTASGTPSQRQTMVHESPGEPRRNRAPRIVRVWLRKSLAIVRPTRKNQHD